MRVLVAILLISAGVAWVLRQKYERPTPEKARDILTKAWAKKPPRTTMPVQIDRFDVGADYTVNVFLHPTVTDLVPEAESAALNQVAAWVRGRVKQQVTVRFTRLGQPVLIARGETPTGVPHGNAGALAGYNP